MAFEYQHPGANKSAEDLESPSSGTSEGCDNLRQRPSSRRSPCSLVLYWASRLALLIWLLVVFAASCVILESLRDSLGRKISLLEDPTGNIPHFPILLHETRLDSQYTLDPANATEADLKRVEKLWTELMPVGQGFVSPRHRLDELPEISTDPEGKPAYPVAVFHELHCLYMIMASHNKLRMGGKLGDDTHLRHCFDYLRQALMCHGDTTIEGIFDVSGLGGGLEDLDQGKTRYATHVCKDYSAVVRWSTDHRTNEYHGIVNVKRPGHLPHGG
ncbi:hypothetical protein F5X68DRAFT_171668 [Plectosphaerella plurivora]|uniref:Oxidase ustYa n=1 Tax=Plectosphaerella plurivora TaxID=936078 RepID=A0A9P8V828_9PEZI|nr:hypothetical protein F5X68DRAFT_171668 [Plectosphaerella plurivora]